MEGPVGADSADEEYMTMDADKWSEHDDTYENGDTLDLDLRGNKDSSGLESGPDSIGQKKEELKLRKVVTNRLPQNNQNPTTAQPPISLPERYITIRRPSINANRGQGTPQLVFLRRTILCLMLLCILLLGGLLGLGFYYQRCCEIQMERVNTLLEQYHMLKNEKDNLTKLSRSLYHVSSTGNFDCITGHDLFILNYDVLEQQMKKGSFHLGNKILEGGNCSIPFSWNCTSTVTLPKGKNNTSTM